MKMGSQYLVAGREEVATEVSCRLCGRLTPVVPAQLRLKFLVFTLPVVTSSAAN